MGREVIAVRGEEEPTRRRIALEILLYALLFVVVGVAFVALRVLKDGPQVLDFRGLSSR